MARGFNGRGPEQASPIVFLARVPETLHLRRDSTISDPILVDPGAAGL
jgi:hypothetical protein